MAADPNRMAIRSLYRQLLRMGARVERLSSSCPEVQPAQLRLQRHWRAKYAAMSGVEGRIAAREQVAEPLTKDSPTDLVRDAFRVPIPTAEHMSLNHDRMEDAFQGFLALAEFSNSQQVELAVQAEQVEVAFQASHNRQYQDPPTNRRTLYE